MTTQDTPAWGARVLVGASLTLNVVLVSFFLLLVYWSETRDTYALVGCPGAGTPVVQPIRWPKRNDPAPVISPVLIPPPSTPGGVRIQPGNTPTKRP